MTTAKRFSAVFNKSIQSILTLANTQKIIKECDNICYLLNNFIRCSAYENVIFAWVMHEQSIIDRILSRVDMSGCELKTISLICNRDALIHRLQADVDAGVRQVDVIARSVQRIPLYASLQTIKIDVSHITAAHAADQIRLL